MAGGGATWTDERIERLKALWAGGSSASQIATELGGVSRNAVIGKVHRLGLSARKTSTARPTAPVHTASPRSAPKRNDKPVRPPSPSGGSGGGYAPRDNLAHAVSPSFDPAADIEALPAVAADVVPLARYLTLMELGPLSCRWPIGDPQTPEFRFCGAPAKPGQTYCPSCSAKAFQPQSSSRSRGSR